MPYEQSSSSWRWWHIGGDGEREPNDTNNDQNLSKHLAPIQLDTYTGESNSAITTFGSGSELFDMVVDKFPAWCLDNSSTVGSGVIGSALAEGNTLGHCAEKPNVSSLLLHLQSTLPLLLRIP